MFKGTMFGTDWYMGDIWYEVNGQIKYMYIHIYIQNAVKIRPVRTRWKVGGT